MVTGKGAAITIWRLKPLSNEIVSTMGAAIDKSISVNLAFASNFVQTFVLMSTDDKSG